MKKNAGKAPSYQMYPKDWNENAKLKMCSYSAQGVWIRLVNTSYDMPVKGVFSMSNRPLKRHEVLELLPGKTRVKRKAFDELVKWGVIKQRDDNTFYCKRLYEDMRLREIRIAAGKQGGNPNLVKDLDNQNPKQKEPPSSSSSSSTSIKEKDMLVFDEFRKLYPGKKRGLETEFTNFTKKHKDWREVLPTLKGLLEKQIDLRKRNDITKTFNPHWKNLATWLNGRFWEEDCGGEAKQTCAFCPATEKVMRKNVNDTDVWFCPDCAWRVE